MALFLVCTYADSAIPVALALTILLAEEAAAVPPVEPPDMTPLIERILEISRDKAFLKLHDWQPAAEDVAARYRILYGEPGDSERIGKLPGISPVSLVVEPLEWGEPEKIQPDSNDTAIWHIEAKCGCEVAACSDWPGPNGGTCAAHPFAMLDEALRRLREAADGK